MAAAGEPERIAAARADGAPFPYERFAAPEPAAAPPRPGGGLALALQDELPAWEPSRPAGAWRSIVRFVQEPLLGLEFGAARAAYRPRPAPGLASSWERAPDGLTLTLTLRDGLRWGPGADGAGGGPLDAAAAAASLLAARDGGAPPAPLDWLEHAEASDATTLVLRLARPEADAPVLLAAVPLAPQLSGPFPAGSGPFAVGRASADEVELRPNHAHWRGAPALASVTVRCGLRGAAQLAAACAGAVDAGDALPEAVEAADELLWARPDMVIAAAPVLAAGGSWAFDLADPRFADQRVRRALSLALDRATIRARAHGGHARHVPVQAWPFVLDAPPTPADLGPWHRHDLATARELLAAAGQPALRFTVAASDDAPPAVRRERVLMAEQLRAAGVGARLEAQPARAFAARWAAADFAGVADGPATAPPAARAWYHDQVVTRRAGPGANHWRIADPELDRWAEAQRVELDPYARRELLRRSWDHLQDRVYRIERAQPFPLAARPAWLRGWRALTPFAATDVAAAWGGGSVATWRDERLERS